MFAFLLERGLTKREIKKKTKREIMFSFSQDIHTTNLVWMAKRKPKGENASGGSLGPRLVPSRGSAGKPGRVQTKGPDSITRKRKQLHVSVLHVCRSVYVSVSQLLCMYVSTLGMNG